MDYERFSSLVTPHTATITRMAIALLGVADGEDAAQEALMRAWRAWPNLREAGSTRSWLMQITVNICRSWRARGQGLRQGVTEPLEDANLLEDARSATLGAVEHVDALDLRQALLTLHDEARQLIALRFYVGLDSTEIGDLLGESPATVRTRLRRTIIQLRRTLDGHHATSASAS